MAISVLVMPRAAHSRTSPSLVVSPGAVSCARERLSCGRSVRSKQPRSPGPVPEMKRIVSRLCSESRTRTTRSPGAGALCARTLRYRPPRRPRRGQPANSLRRSTGHVVVADRVALDQRLSGGIRFAANDCSSTISSCARSNASKPSTSFCASPDNGSPRLTARRPAAPPWSRAPKIRLLGV